MSQAQFRDSLLLERRLELAFEGHRWYDLARTKQLIAAMKIQNSSIKIEDRHYLFPIPQTGRDVNSKLVQKGIAIPSLQVMESLIVEVTPEEKPR